MDGVELNGDLEATSRVCQDHDSRRLGRHKQDFSLAELHECEYRAHGGK
jgi:hypothetical protein